MRLLLDECVGGHLLLKKLKAAGHDVERSVDAIGGGVEDLAVFALARENNRVIVTLNNRDFEALGIQEPDHPGMLFIYQDNDGRDMSYEDIVRAIGNVEKTCTDGIARQMHVLNGFRW